MSSHIARGRAARGAMISVGELAGFREHGLDHRLGEVTEQALSSANAKPLDAMLAGSSDQENVSKRCEAVDNDVPVILCLDIFCLTWPIFSGSIDVGGAHAVRTRVPMIIVMSGDEHDLMR